MSASKIYPEANEGVLISRIKTREYPSLSALCGGGSGGLNSFVLPFLDWSTAAPRVQSYYYNPKKTWCLWQRKFSHSPFPWIIHICEVENRKQ